VADKLHSSPWEIAIHRWVVHSSGIAQDRVRWADDGQPQPKAIDGPWLSLRKLGGSGDAAWTEYHPRVFDLAAQSVTAVAGNQLTVPSHPFRSGDGPVRLVGSALPGGLAAGVDYWAIYGSSALLRLAATFEDAINEIAIVLSGSGTLPISIEGTAATRRAGNELLQVTRKAGVLELGVQCRGGDAESILESANLKGQSPRARGLLHDANLGLFEIGAVQNVGAAINAATYEPRASMTVRLSRIADHVDTTTRIDSFETESVIA
jgi:hypothetical protein